MNTQISNSQVQVNNITDSEEREIISNALDVVQHSYEYWQTIDNVNEANLSTPTSNLSLCAMAADAMTYVVVYIESVGLFSPGDEELAESAAAVVSTAMDLIC